MATRRNSDKESAATKQSTEKQAAEKADKAVMDEASEAMREAQGQGFIGTKVDPLPNEAYSLESGPDSPGVLEAKAAVDEANNSDR